MTTFQIIKEKLIKGRRAIINEVKCIFFILNHPKLF